MNRERSVHRPQSNFHGVSGTGKTKHKTRKPPSRPRLPLQGVLLLHPCLTILSASLPHSVLASAPDSAGNGEKETCQAFCSLTARSCTLYCTWQVRKFPACLTGIWRREPQEPCPLGLPYPHYINCSVQFHHSVVSDSLRPHKSQHARPPSPSATPGVYSDSRPSSQ